MLDADVKVTKIAEEPKYEEDGTRVSFIRVEFRVGKNGPFIEKFNKLDYTADVRDQRLNDYAREVRTS